MDPGAGRKKKSGGQRTVGGKDLCYRFGMLKRKGALQRAELVYEYAFMGLGPQGLRSLSNRGGGRVGSEIPSWQGREVEGPQEGRNFREASFDSLVN